MAGIAVVFLAVLVLALGIVFIIFAVGYLSNDDKKDDTMIKTKFKNKK